MTFHENDRSTPNWRARKRASPGPRSSGGHHPYLRSVRRAFRAVPWGYTWGRDQSLPRALAEAWDGLPDNFVDLRMSTSQCLIDTEFPVTEYTIVVYFKYNAPEAS